MDPAAVNMAQVAKTKTGLAGWAAHHDTLKAEARKATAEAPAAAAKVAPKTNPKAKGTGAPGGAAAKSPCFLMANEGTCKFGGACKFSHAKKDLAKAKGAAPPPPAAKSVPLEERDCMFWLGGGHCKGIADGTCKRMHRPEAKGKGLSAPAPKPKK